MRTIQTIALSVLVSLAAASNAFADVQLSIQDGLVSISAKNATVRQILAEWAKIGQTQIVNLERIPGDPITIELKNISEERALDVLLRMVSGYMAAPRAVAVANASRFDRIIVLPTSAAPTTSARESAREAMSANVTAPSAYSQPAPYGHQPAPTPVVQPQPAEADANDAADNQQASSVVVAMPTEIPTPASPAVTGSNMRQQLETVDPRHFKLPPGLLQGGVAMPPTGAVAPQGVARPGIIVQPPPQPGQPPIIRQ